MRVRAIVALAEAVIKALYLAFQDAAPVTSPVVAMLVIVVL